MSLIDDPLSGNRNLSDPEVLIVGGGLAGLCCARRLHDAGRTFLILEGSDAAGGRARTDRHDGFLLDRGFQVLLTAYPEAKQFLDYKALQPKYFEPGALVRYRGKFHRFADPWRRPRHLLATALSPVASFGDKLRIARLRNRVGRGSLEQLYQRPAVTTLERLQEQGFSSRIIDHFFRPFLGGIFLEPELQTSSRMFEFVFRMFAEGDAALPAQGMGQMADQLVRSLPPDSVRINARVVQVAPDRVRLDNGDELPASHVVVACDGPNAGELMGSGFQRGTNGVTCFYFAASRPPVDEPILVLNGEGRGPVNNLCVPSQVAAAYAPAGRSLISATVLGVDANEQLDKLQADVLQQMKEWFGSEVDQWRHLKTYRIPGALPSQEPPALSPVVKPAVADNGLYLCGDYLDTASIQGAMISGRRAAEGILEVGVQTAAFPNGAK